jgi:hypothetical protein
MLSDTEKKRAWNDLPYLRDMITLVARQKNMSMKLCKDLYEKLSEAKRSVYDIESRLKVAKAEEDEAESSGLELTKRLMELETEAGCKE